MNNSLYNIPGSRFDIVDNSQITNMEVNRKSDCSIVSWAKNAFKVLQNPHNASYHVLKETNDSLNTSKNGETN